MTAHLVDLSHAIENGMVTYPGLPGPEITDHLTREASHDVYAPGTELIEGAQSVTDWSGTLPKTGDYEIIVFPEDEKTNTTFTLEITIR